MGSVSISLPDEDLPGFTSPICSPPKSCGRSKIFLPKLKKYPGRTMSLSQVENFSHDILQYLVNKILSIFALEVMCI